MKRKTISLIFIVLVSSILSAFPVNACPYGKTSLEVWKEFTIVEKCGGWVTITGTIYIQNDPTNTAYIAWVKDSVQGKAKKEPWETIPDQTAFESPGFEIGPGDRYELEFSVTFQKGDYKAYRNVVRVLLNDDRGPRYFKYRLSFEV